jgi:hypothetical protein
MKCFICKKDGGLEEIGSGSYKCCWCGGGWDNKNKKWVKKMDTFRKRTNPLDTLASLYMLGLMYEQLKDD